MPGLACASDMAGLWRLTVFFIIVLTNPFVGT